MVWAPGSRSPVGRSSRSGGSPLPTCRRRQSGRGRGCQWQGRPDFIPYFFVEKKILHLLLHLLLHDPRFKEWLPVKAVRGHVDHPAPSECVKESFCDAWTQCDNVTPGHCGWRSVVQILWLKDQLHVGRQRQPVPVGKGEDLRVVKD